MSNAEVNEQLMKEELVETMELLKPTPELAEKMVESIHPDNYDASDKRLVESVKAIINLEAGIGPSVNGQLIDWVTAMVGVGVANAIGFSDHVPKLLEDNPESLKKLVVKLAKAISQHLDNSEEESIKRLLADPQMTLFIWGLYCEGIKQGMISGWRQHEIALVEAMATESEEVDK